MTLVIGYDTSGRVPQASCMAIGRPDRIAALHGQIEKRLSAEGCAKGVHWYDVPTPVRRKCRQHFEDAIRGSGVVFYTFTHARPHGWARADYYFKHLPNRLAAVIEDYLHNTGNEREELVLECDDDFQVIKGGGGTDKFVKAFLERLGSRLRGVEVSAAKAGKREYEIRLNWPGGHTRLLRGSVKDSGTASVLLADRVLGMGKDYGRMDRVIPGKIR